MRSLVIAPQWIGDAVMTQPLVARLAARGESVTVAALPWVAPVFQAMPELAGVIELPFAHGRLDWAARRKVGAALRGRFDTAYVLPNSLKSALLPWFAGIARRVGYRGEARALLLTDSLPRPVERPPMVAFYLALAGGPAPACDDVPQTASIASRSVSMPSSGSAAWSVSVAGAPALAAKPAQGIAPQLTFDAAQVRAACLTAGVQPQRFFAFAPGAEYGPAKRWPAAHYAALALALHRAYGEPVLLLGSPAEAALCDEIASSVDADAAPGACRVLAGHCTLADAMALLSAARGVVSNDSGLMHVAAACGVPQVAVFGSTSPSHTPPLNPGARVLWLKSELGLACMPCFERRCRYGHLRCLTAVSPERAHAALDDAIEGVAAAVRR